MVIEIISSAFADNPMIDVIVGSDVNRERKVRHLAQYAYGRCKRRNGVFMSSDETGVALCYHFGKKKNGLPDLLDQWKLAIRVIGVSRVMEAIRREKYRQSQRPASGDYLYFWFLGVHPQGAGKGAVHELRNRVFHHSKKTGLPIFLETTLWKNELVYQRYGFETFHIWPVPNTNISMRFMKREPE